MFAVVTYLVMLPLFFLFVPSVFAAAEENSTVAGISVAISDNLIVIEGRARSGQIDLVNGGEDPMEFTVFPMKDPSGIVASAEPILRWAPERAVAAAHRSLSFRVLARPSPELEPGEYAYQFGVRAQVQREAPPIRMLQDGEEPEPLISVSVPVVPVLPVTVYVRHRMETPRVDPEPLVLTPEDEDNLGYFKVVKRVPNVSFVGQIQVVDRDTGEVLSSGRLHLAQQGTNARVSMPRVFYPADRAEGYCLRLWDHFPGEGEPYISLCE